ncbi:hypothetical protein F5984_10515 [Rudanella paleaurantiibacter]|uniref:Outer membrane beta-barrel protein n=1 Tax=Rudanella paleaurantiibacter TaxID=2614655 RepID=A0A7J5U0S2_9BACT|nr:hypothetical protein [Rudanella paleaurantiibacter]KAB7731227.1 hypothetical protein F5984_10515 [Rudanella paleaurantiibacter]
MRLNTTNCLLVWLLAAGLPTMAQPIPVPLGPVANDTELRPPVRRPWSRDITTYYRMGWQTINLAPLNAELARNGYSALTGRFRTVGMGTQLKISRQPIFLLTDINLGIGTRSATSATNKASIGVSTFRLGMGYRIVRRAGFQLMPTLGVMSIPIRLRIASGQSQTPTLSAALNNPGASQSTQLNTTAGAVDLGLTANYRFGVQRRYDDCVNQEHALVIALDGGYRVGSRPEFITETNPLQRVSFGSSGWYVGLRIGAAFRTDRKL